MTTPPKPPESAGAPAPRPELDDTPPLLGSWRNIYLLVLGNLALLIALFWALTRAYS
ncbi:hypothetical protein POL68_34835 [Stigmatella sp. ncwal1]|uniref:Uncharacterized protein n=1 Tax=Stigmatella ashevillensis TaxID=2995309 RepID=A0ABT5DJ70_9BACT|nr:hypothetical protein [Stigmatella ashevillena]MDC0713695.1 hypothetical protein [Stigmatella ashevillena]